ncbi:hypothetical protein HBA12_07095 [Tenacibaculum mesophilum]|uniref:hypothetical protein n=1 Tax=Tenacibaculum mesophilum TaxID=104268 RepID=UPI00142FBC59|nr:hypothetical protein [Tenacibaculum mesophilum]KAF9659994.1 hypothetical protein HBA12_07095 [Tenacibaculum mesophilum]
MIYTLNKKYDTTEIKEYHGFPSKEKVNSVYKYIKDENKENLVEEIKTKIKERRTSLDRDVYSTYKASSYFINLAKDKFKLLDNKNVLTQKGKELLNYKSSFFKLSRKEKSFFFLRILESDFHFFISICFFLKLEKKYNLKGVSNEQYNFLDKFYDIRHFNFTSSSLNNFNKVRLFWIEELDLLDTNRNIRKHYIKLIFTHGFELLYDELKQKLDKYEKENFKPKVQYITRKNKFLQEYNNCLKNNKSNIGFVNLYYIKENMNLSYERFQLFLEKFYEEEKNNYNIFYNNIVNSIDKRKRFYIRKKPVINIKVK